MQVAKHYVILVYPFRHAVDLDKRVSRLLTLKSQWQPWWRRLDDEALKIALDDTHFFVPYVRQLIFPETALLPNRGGIDQQTAARNLANLPAHEVARQLHKDGMVRFTHSLAGLSAMCPFLLEFEHANASGEIVEHFSTDVNICWVDVALFPQEVGLLAIKVEVDEKPLEVGRLVDALYYLRLVQPPRIGWKLARWKSRGEELLEFSNANLVDYLLQGLTNEQGSVTANLKEFIARLESGMAVQSYSSTEEGQVYGQAFREFTYVCLSENTDGGTDKDALTAIADSVEHVPPKTHLFNTPADQALYELATCTQVSDPGWEPHPKAVTHLFESGHIALWANWQGLALHDNVTFMGRGVSGLTMVGLPHNVESDYFHLYLFTLYQRVRLDWVSGDLMRKGADLHKELEDARGLWDKFTMFRNHYWFAEVTFKPQGRELYSRYQHALGTPKIFEHIRREMEDLQEYYERKAERHIEGVLNFLAIVGLPIEIMVHLFAHTLIEQASWEQFLVTTLIGVLIAVAIWVIWDRFLSEVNWKLPWKRFWRK